MSRAAQVGRGGAGSHAHIRIKVNSERARGRAAAGMNALRDMRSAFCTTSSRQ